jgi:hypothetical protein
MTDKFDLRKYLIENKVTTNAKMLSENQNFSIKLKVPKVYYNVDTGELSDSPYDFGAEIELEDMDITNYSNGNDLSEVIFSDDYETAKDFEERYPHLFQVVSGGLTENEEEHEAYPGDGKFKEDAKTHFADLVEKYGLEIVTDVLANSWENFEDEGKTDINAAYTRFLGKKRLIARLVQEHYEDWGPDGALAEQNSSEPNFTSDAKHYLPKQVAKFGVEAVAKFLENAYMNFEDSGADDLENMYQNYLESGEAPADFAVSGGKKLTEEFSDNTVLDLTGNPETATRVNEFIVEWMADTEHQYSVSSFGNGLNRLAKQLGCSPEDLETVQAVDSYFGLETILEIKFPEDMVELTEGNTYVFAHLMAPGNKIVFWSQDGSGTESEPTYWDKAAITKQCIEPVKQMAS